MNHTSMKIVVFFGFLSILSFFIFFVYLNKYQKRYNNKIIRLVIMPPLLALLGLLPWWLLSKSMTSLKLGILGNIFVFVVVWVSIAGGLIIREKPVKEQNKVIWKVMSVYGWSLIALFVLLLFFIIVMLALIILKR